MTDLAALTPAVQDGAADLRVALERLSASHSRRTIVEVVGLIVLAAAFMFGLHTMHAYDIRLARAEQTEKLHAAENVQLTDAIKAAQADNLTKDAAILALQRQKDATDALALAVLTRVRNETPPQIRVESAKTLGAAPTVTVEAGADKFCYTPAQVQEFILNKVALDQCKNDLGDVTGQLGATRGKVDKLTTALADETAVAKNDEATMKSYKKVAKHGKLRNFFNGAGRVIEHGAVIALLAKVLMG